MQKEKHGSEQHREWGDIGADRQAHVDHAERDERLEVIDVIGERVMLRLRDGTRLGTGRSYREQVRATFGF